MSIKQGNLEAAEADCSAALDLDDGYIKVCVRVCMYVCERDSVWMYVDA